jgi:cytidylate kinase
LYSYMERRSSQQRAQSREPLHPALGSTYIQLHKATMTKVIEK